MDKLGQNNGDLPNYEDYILEEDINGGDGQQEQVAGASKPTAFTGVHATSFKDMLLKPEIQKSIVDCGFEHPSDVQQKCIPEAILGVDVLC